MSNPYLIQIPFALNGQRSDIKLNKSQDQDIEDATWDIGFPPETMIPEDIGGVPPKGVDFNGVFYAVSSICAHYSRGDQIHFDSVFANSIGGYSKGFRLTSNDYLREYISLVDNNKVDPNGSNTSQYWGVFSGQGSVPVATSTTTGTVKLINSLTSNSQEAALTAAQGKILNDRTQAATPTNSGIVKLINSLSSSDQNSALSAAQGKILSDILDIIAYSPIPFYGNSAPSGFIAVDGRTITSDQYPKLFERYGSKLPDLRGYSIRGLGGMSGLLGVRQEDAIQNIVGETTYLTRNDDTSLGGKGTGAIRIKSYGAESFTGYTDRGGLKYGLDFNASRVVRTAEETRSKTVAFLYIVKAG